jgi:hypothetical protein
MRNSWIGWTVVVTAVLAIPLVLSAQSDSHSVPPTAKGGVPVSTDCPGGCRPIVSIDTSFFAGIWNPAPFMQPKGEVNPLDLGGHPNPLPPFTPAGEAKYLTNTKFIAAGAVLDCDPFGVSRNFFTPRPFEILVTRDRLVQHFEYYDNWREIWTDGRKIPADIDPEYMGYSSGHWDGDTFVVDSGAYNGKAFLTWQGFPISESMHQTERWQRVDADTLKIVFTFDDPVNYAKPWSITGFWKLRKDWVLDAHPCTLSAIKEYDDRVNHADKLPGRDYAKPDSK